MYKLIYLSLTEVMETKLLHNKQSLLFGTFVKICEIVEANWSISREVNVKINSEEWQFLVWKKIVFQKFRLTFESTSSLYGHDKVKEKERNWS